MGYLKQIIRFAGFPRSILQHSYMFDIKLPVIISQLTGRKTILSSIHPNVVEALLPHIRCIDVVQQLILSEFTWENSAKFPYAGYLDRLSKILMSIIKFVDAIIVEIEGMILETCRIQLFQCTLSDTRTTLEEIENNIIENMDRNLELVFLNSEIIEKNLITCIGAIKNGYLKLHAITSQCLQGSRTSQSFDNISSHQSTRSLGLSIKTTPFQPVLFETEQDALDEISIACKALIDTYQQSFIQAIHQLLLHSLASLSQTATPDIRYHSQEPSISTTNSISTSFTPETSKCVPKQENFLFHIEVNFIDGQAVLMPSLSAIQSTINNIIRCLFDSVKLLPIWNFFSSDSTEGLIRNQIYRFHEKQARQLDDSSEHIIDDKETRPVIQPAINLNEWSLTGNKDDSDAEKTSNPRHLNNDFENDTLPLLLLFPTESECESLNVTQDLDINSTLDSFSQTENGSGSPSIMTSPITAKDELTQDFVWQRLHDSSSLIRATFMTTTAFLAIGDLSTPLGNRFRTFSDFAIPLPDIGEKLKFSGTTNYPFDFPTFAIPSSFHAITSQEFQTMFRHFLTDTFSHTTNQHLFSAETHKSLSAPGPAHISNESIEISSPRRHYVKTDNQTFSLAVPLTVDNPPLVEINFDSLPSIPKDILNRAYIVYLLGFPDLTRLPTRIAFERQPSTPTLRFHPDPIMYDCPFCEESLVSFVTFTNHMNATHKNIDPVEKIRVVVEKRCEYIQRSVNNLRLWREILLSVKFSSDDEAEVLPSEDHNADRSKVEQSRRTLPNAPDQQSDDQEGLATQKVPAETLKFVEELLAPAAINRFVRFSFTSQMIPVLLEKIEELIQELYKVVKTDAEDLLSIVSDSFDRIQTVLNTNLGRRNISSEASYNFSDGSTGQDREVSANIGDLQNIERVSLLRAVLDGIDREPNIEEILSVTRGCLEVYSTLGTATPSPLEVTLIQQQKMVDILVGFQRYLSRWSTEKQSTLMSQFQQTRMSIVFQINMYLASLPQLGLEDDIDDTVLELSVRQRVSLVNQVAEHLQEKKHHLADVNAEAVMLSLDTTVSVELEGAINRMAYVKGLMSFYLDFLVWLGNLRISRLLEVQLDRVSSERVHFQSKLKRIHELVDVTPIASSQPHPVENRMNMELTSLRQRLFICDIDPRHMKRRHWEELATRTGKDILKRCFSIPDSEGLISPTFGELFEATIEDHEEEFRTMAVSAFHESKVETELNQMLDAWHNRIRLEFVRDDQPAFTRLQTTLYNSWADKWQFLDIMLNDCFEISDVSINNAISKAQNSLTEILALHHNKYISPFLSQLFEIRDSLLDLPSKLQLFMETQALWVNLRNLFGSRSVINQISEVHRRFVDLTEDWARLIGGILKDPTPYRVFGAGEAISHVLPHISEHLVQCKREIMPFLKMNADLYPALHLLPIDSIIASLSYAASPKDLVTVIRPLFPGITDLIVDSDQLNPLLTLRQTSNTQSSVESEDISRTDVTESSSRSPISKMEPKIAYNDNDSDSLSSITPIQRPVARPITAAIQTVQVLQPIQKDRTIYRRRHSVNVATMKQNSFHIAGPVIRLPPVNITPTQQDMMRQRRKSFAGGTTTPVAKPAGAKPTLLLKTNSRNGMVIPKAKSFQLSVKASESTTETKHVQRVIRIVGFQGCMGERVLFHEPLQFLPDGDRVSLFVGLENAIHNSVNAKMIESIVQSFPLMVLFFDSSWNIRIGPTSETGGQDNSDNVNLSDNESFSDTTSNDSREMQPFPEDTLTLLRHYSTSNIQRPQLSKDTLMDSINGITQNVAPDLAASPITYESSDSTFFDRSIVPHSARVRFNVVETAKVGPIESLTDYLSSLVPAFPLVEIKTMHRSLLKTFLKDGLDQTIFLALTTHLNKYLSENWKPTDS